VTGLVRLVEAEGARFRERESVPLTYLPFVIEAAARALRKFPLLNASWQGEEILVHRQIHIGVPVALEESVIVPVIRDADQQSVAGLARTLRRLVERARSGQLTVPEVEGATFTVNNTGAFGSILSQPIIFPPQAGMLTLEAIVKRPVVVEGERHRHPVHGQPLPLPGPPGGRRAVRGPLPPAGEGPPGKLHPRDAHLNRDPSGAPGPSFVFAPRPRQRSRGGRGAGPPLPGFRRVGPGDLRSQAGRAPADPVPSRTSEGLRSPPRLRVSPRLPGRRSWPPPAPPGAEAPALPALGARGAWPAPPSPPLPLAVGGEPAPYPPSPRQSWNASPSPPPAGPTGRVWRS